MVDYSAKNGGTKHLVGEENLQAMADPEDERHAGAVARYGRRFDLDDIGRATIEAAPEKIVRKRA